MNWKSATNNHNRDEERMTPLNSEVKFAKPSPAENILTYHFLVQYRVVSFLDHEHVFFFILLYSFI